MNLKQTYHILKLMIFKRNVPIYYYYLKKYETFNKNKKLEIKLKKLIVVYKTAFSKSPYLNKKYRSAGLTINSIKNLSDINKIPFLTRKEIIENREEILTVEKNKNITLGTTGGTTGTPMTYYRDSKLPYESIYMFYLDIWNINYACNSVYLWRKPNTSLLQKLFNRLFWFPTIKKRFDASSLNKNNCDQILEKLNKYKPPLIQGYSGSIFQFSKYLSDFNLSLNYKPKGVWITAAPTSKQDKKFISKSLDSIVYDEYGSAEIPWIAIERKANSNLLYVNELARNVELININKDNYGEIVITDLFDLSFPKIRYVNGDLAKFHYSSTEEQKIIEPVKGRVSDFLIIPKVGKIDGSYLTTIFNKYPEATNGFQFVQNNLEKLELRVIVNVENSKSNTQIKKVKELLIEKFEDNIKIDVIKVDKLIIDRGKMKYVIRNIDGN